MNHFLFSFEKMDNFYNLGGKNKRTSDVIGYDYIYIQDTGKSSNIQNLFGTTPFDTFCFKK